MDFIIAVVIITLLSICFINYFNHRRKINAYRKASKKWDEIVIELSKRK